MPASKVVNVDEAKRWIVEGRSYQWIIGQYRDRYQVDTTVTMWSNFRRRQGIGTRLLLALHRSGIAHDCTGFTLEVRVSNHAAQEMYRDPSDEEP